MTLAKWCGPRLVVASQAMNAKTGQSRPTRVHSGPRRECDAIVSVHLIASLFVHLLSADLRLSVDLGLSVDLRLSADWRETEARSWRAPSSFRG